MLSSSALCKTCHVDHVTLNSKWSCFSAFSAKGYTCDFCFGLRKSSVLDSELGKQGGFTSAPEPSFPRVMGGITDMFFYPRFTWCWGPNPGFQASRSSPELQSQAPTSFLSTSFIRDGVVDWLNGLDISFRRDTQAVATTHWTELLLPSLTLV